MQIGTGENRKNINSNGARAVTPYYQDKWVTIYHGDCREVLPKLTSGTSAIVTDPPYELGFMGKAWDKQGISFQPETWRILREACKPGAMLLSFGGTRTFHRIAVAIEDGGWELRDTIMWVYGSGFPKSRDIGKDMEKLAVGGIKNLEVIGSKQGIKVETGTQGYSYSKEYVAGKSMGGRQISGEIPVYKINNSWEGYGTALKPAFEPVLVCMNPLDGTFANNALKHGVAGLNIDECRVEYQSEQDKEKAKIGFKGQILNPEVGWNQNNVDRTEFDQSKGRFPANFIHDGSQQVMELFPNPHSAGSKRKPGTAIQENAGSIFLGDKGSPNNGARFGDSGSAARFFKKCEPTLVDLYLTPKHDIMSVCKNIYVDTAERLLELIQATRENTAHLNVVDLQGEQSDPLVKSAVSHADICEIFTALVLVRIKNLASNQETSQAIRDYTSNFRECSLLLNLVSSAEIQANTDITQITTSLLKSFGSANPAITNYIPEIRRSEPARFLYTPKASKAERNKGCEELEERQYSYDGRTKPIENPYQRNNSVSTNSHPTVKPLALMEYLVKLVKMPEYNLIIDPFMGSGTTLLACIRLGIPCIGIDSDEKSCEIAAKRCSQEVMELGI